jgi:hypothetical protein
VEERFAKVSKNESKKAIFAESKRFSDKSGIITKDELLKTTNKNI